MATSLKGSKNQWNFLKKNCELSECNFLNSENLNNFNPNGQFFVGRMSSQLADY